jgi:hypothetical protein
LLALPLVYASREPGLSTTIVGNVFHHRDGPTSSSVIFPLAFWGKNTKEKSAWGFLLPLAYWRHDPKSLTIATPAGFWHGDQDGRSAALFVPPILHHRSPDTELDSVLGLYWRVRDRASDQTTTTFLPFFLHRTSPHGRLTALGVAPLLGYSARDEDGSRSAGVFPLAFFGWGGEHRYAFVLPFLFHISSGERSNTVVLPLFETSRSPSGRNGCAPLALLFWGSDKTSSYVVQFPFLWHFREGQDSTMLLLPFLYRDRSSQSSFFAAGPPLLWAYNRHNDGRHDFGLFPLAFFSRDRDSFSNVVLPLLLYWNKDAANTTVVQFPFLWHFANRTSGTSTTVVPPFFMRHRNAEGTFNAAGVLPLLAYWSRDANGRLRGAGLMPLLFYGSDGQNQYRVVAPFFFDFVRPDRRTTVVAPLFWRRSSSGESLTIAGVPPLWAYYGRTGDGRSLGLFPLVFVRTGVEAYQVVFPMFWRFSGRDSASTTVVPLYHHCWAPDHSATGILPLLTFWGRDGDSSYAIQFPFLWHFANRDQASTSLFPVYFHGHDANSRTTVIPPLLLGWGRSEGSSYAIQFPFYWHFHGDGDGDGEGLTSTTVFPLFHYRSAPSSRGLFTLLAGAQRSEDSRFWYVGPIMHERGRSSDWTAVFPLWFSSSDRARADQESSSQILLPFFYRFNRTGVAHTTVLLPFYVRHRNQRDDATTTVMPLFFRREAGQDSATVGFPLYWSFQSAERGTSMLLPFFVHVRRPTWGATYVFPNVYYRTGQGTAAGTYELHVFPFWEQAARRPGDTFWQALLGVFGYERIGRNRYLKLLFIPFELKPAPAATTEWYGRSERRTVRGLDPHVW